jgi:hypothetical protein
MNPLPNRRAIECEQHLQAFLKFYQPIIPSAVDAYHEKNPQSAIKREMSGKILELAIQGYEKHYWDLLSEIFLLKGDGLQEGIHGMVEEFHKEVGMEPCIALLYNSEFHQFEEDGASTLRHRASWRFNDG